MPEHRQDEASCPRRLAREYYAEIVKSEPKNEIVVYQPNETMRLEVLVENESVWLTQSKSVNCLALTVL